MLREVVFPMRTESENWYRGASMFTVRRKTEKQIGTATLFLRSQLPSVPIMLAGAVQNQIDVKLVRIASADLDRDNLHGALKAVQDAVARWIGVDDRARCLRIHHLQHLCRPGYDGVRVEIRDLVAGEEIRRVVGAAPELRGDAFEQRARGEPVPGLAPQKRARSARRPRAQQVPLAFMEVFAILPWDQDGSDEAVLTEIPGLKRAIDPPDDILYPVPKGCAVPGSGSSVRLHRRRLTLPDAGDCWIYALPGARL